MGKFGRIRPVGPISPNHVFASIFARGRKVTFKFNAGLQGVSLCRAIIGYYTPRVDSETNDCSKHLHYAHCARQQDIKTRLNYRVIARTTNDTISTSRTSLDCIFKIWHSVCLNLPSHAAR